VKRNDSSEGVQGQTSNQPDVVIARQVRLHVRLVESQAHPRQLRRHQDISPIHFQNFQQTNGFNEF